MLKVNFMLQTFTKHGKNVPKFYIEDENIGLETFWMFISFTLIYTELW